MSNEQDIAQYMNQVGQSAREASRDISKLTTNQKNQGLLAIAELLDSSKAALESANNKDLATGKENGLSDAMLDRLALTPARIDGMIEGLQQVAKLPDPVGTITDLAYQPSGIQVGRMRVPLGVIGIIYESRPNVTVEAASLCLKSGNAAVLRGGSEAAYSNQAIGEIISAGLKQASLPAHAVQVIKTTDRAAVGEMITSPQWIDVIVPRGGKGLIERISNEATVPVIKHLDGICHIYIDNEADLEKALTITVNSKTQRLGTCNTLETLLVHEDIAKACLPTLATLLTEKSVELRGCERTQALIECKAAQEADWHTEYLAAILSIKIVPNIDAAITHINHYGSHHTDNIITENYTKTRQFMTEVDSSSVMVNASTRFADGFEYGLGAEIGISTDKIHARGPVGLEGLTSQKYVVFGNGHIRQ